MSQLRGGGVIETFCPACGFGTRQSVARPVKDSAGARARWEARFDALRTLGLPRADAPPSSGIRFTPLGCFALGSTILLAVAVRAMFVGYPSFEPVLFAELYVMLFATVMFVLTFARTIQYISGRQVVLLFVGAVAGVVVVIKVVNALKLIPVTWEPDYCGDVSYPSTSPDFRLPPKTFRCVGFPIELAGMFLGWWVTYWLITQWERAGRQAESP